MIVMMMVMMRAIGNGEDAREENKRHEILGKLKECR